MLISIDQYQSLKRVRCEKKRKRLAIEEIQESVESLKEEERFEEALEHLKEMAQYSDQLESYEQGEYGFNMALCLKRVMEETAEDLHEEILMWLNYSLDAFPHSAATLQNRGNIHADLGNHEQALKDYTRGIELSPEDPELYFYRGITYEDSGDTLRAIADYTAALKLDPEDPVYHYNRGILYENVGNLLQGFNDYNRAIELFPDYADALNNRGLIYEKQGKYEDAIADFTAAIEHDADNAYIYLNNRGNAQIACDNHQLAREDYRQALEFNPLSPDPYLNLMELSLTTEPTEFKEIYHTFKEICPSLILSSGDRFMVEYLQLTDQMINQKPYQPLLDKLAQKRPDIKLTWSFKDLNHWLSSKPLPKKETSLLQSLQHSSNTPVKQEQKPWLKLF